MTPMALVGHSIPDWLERLPCKTESASSSLSLDGHCVGNSASPSLTIAQRLQLMSDH